LLPIAPQYWPPGGVQSTSQSPGSIPASGVMMAVPALPDVPPPVPLVAELPPPEPGMPGAVPPLPTPVDEPGGLSPALQLTLAAAGTTSPRVAKTQLKKLRRFGVIERSFPA
jgi:hypothetical protein